MRITAQAAGAGYADGPMRLPFTPDQCLAVFAAYNREVWPAQIVAHLLGLGMVLALLHGTRRTRRIVGAGLGLMWVWTGVAYHALFFAAINKAASPCRVPASPIGWDHAFGM